jgi:hypothetical protein
MGIGQSAPAAGLDIRGVLTASSSLALRIADSGGVDRLVVTNSGNMGIGTTQPVALLSIGSQAQLQVDSTGNLAKANNLAYIWPGAQGAASSYLMDDGTGFLSWQAYTANPKAWDDGGTAVYLNTTTDKVGIGMSTPVAKLDVRGSGTSVGFNLRIADTLGTARLLVQDDGAIGVGMTQPGALVHIVSGSILQESRVSPVIAGSVSNATYMDDSVAVYVSGKYAYVAGELTHSLAVIDVSNVSNPVVVGAVVNSTYMNWSGGVAVAGQYAYVTSRFEPTMAVVDISNASNPVVVGGINNSTYMTGSANVVVSGQYAYVAGDNSFAVIDVSNASNPVLVGGVTNTTYLTAVQNFYVSGSYAYVVSWGDTLAVVDVRNASAPVVVGGVANTTYMDFGSGIYVSGRYAYVTGVTSDSLGIVDISNASSPVFVGGISNTTYMNSSGQVVVAGKYAYIVAGDSDSLAVVDVSNPQSPVIAAAIINSTYLGSPRGFSVSGKYAYVANQYADALTIVSLPGIDSPAASIGDIAASTVEVSENMDVGNNLYVRSGVNVGPGGIKSDGPMSVSGQSNASLAAFEIGNATGTPLFRVFNSGNVGIGTTGPASVALEVNGNLKAKMNTDYSGNTAQWAGSSAGTVYQLGYDIAETFDASEDVEVGDILVVDNGLKIASAQKAAPRNDGNVSSLRTVDEAVNEAILSNKQYVRKSRSPSDRAIIGVVSGAPAVLFEGSQLQVAPAPGAFTRGRKPPVALAGRVAVKVNLENGPIETGDYISPSSTPGVGMKARSDSPIVGIALEKFRDLVGKGFGYVKMFVYNYGREDVARARAQLEKYERVVAELENEIP